jgi:hypothetical protein
MNKKIVVMIVTGIMIFSGFMILFSSNHNVNSVNPVNSTIIKPAITSYNPDITNVTDVLGATGISYDSAFNLIFVDSQFAHPSTQSYAGDITILNGSNYNVVSAPTFNNLIFQPYYNPYYKIDYNLESGGFSGSNFYYGTDAVANGVNDSQHFMTGTYDTSNHYEYLETNFNGTNQFIAFENTTAIASYSFTSQVSSFNMSYDSITNSLMTAYQNSSTVQGLLNYNLTSDKATYYPLGYLPYWNLYYPAKNELFTLGFYTDYPIKVYNATTMKLITSFGNFTDAMGFMFIKNVLYIEYNNLTLSMVNPLTYQYLYNLTTPSGKNLMGITYDSATNKVLLSNMNGEEGSTLGETPLYSINPYILPSTYNLEIKEKGLPSGTNYTYDLNGRSYTVKTNEQNYSFSNGNYSLSVNSLTGYTVNYPSTITINNNNVIAYINFTKQPVYNLTLKENGLPSGTSFTYTFNGNSYTLTNNSYNYVLSNGSYSLSVNNVNGYNVVYPSTITIDGKNQTDYINFSKIAQYTLFVKETGLSNGTIYHIFIGSTEYTSSTPYNNVTGLTNGTYSFSVDTISGYLLHSYPSSFTINGANQTIDLTFNKNASTYNVNIVENGLANVNNIKWSIVFNGTTYISSNSNDIIIGGILNGSYSFKVNPITNYIIDKYNTTLIVKGNTTYNIYFNETFKFILKGLNINVFWAITFNSSAIDEVNNYVNLSLVNQTFNLKIIVPTGYSVTPYPSSITINGKNVYLNVTFSKIVITSGHYIVTFYIEGYNGNWSLTINGEQYYSNHIYLNITLTNGSYIPLVQLPANYQLQPLNPLVVNGNNTVYVIYAKAYFNWVYYEPYIAIVILILGVLIIPAVIRRS